MIPQQMTKLHLSGWAYLDKCIIGERYISIRLRVLINMQHKTLSEEMTLDCIVEDDLRLLEALNPMYEAWKKHHRVTLQFSCQYQHFGFCYPGLTAEDPKNLLTLNAKLISVGEWYCDGQLMTYAAVA